jgi:hypothetical protein
MKKLSTMVAAILVFSAGAVQAQQTADTSGQDSWIHVRVEEEGTQKVSLNLPLPLIDVALRNRSGDGFAEDLRLGDRHDVSVEDLRRVWRQVRDAGEAELVNLEDDDAQVRVYKRGDRVHVDVDEDGAEKVRIELPAAIVDALLGGEGDRLDLSAAARELAKVGEGHIVRIDDRDEKTRVRVWVDQQSGDPANGS